MCNSLRTLTETRAGLWWVLLLSAAPKAGLAFTGKVINPDGMLYLEAARLISEGRFHEAVSLSTLPLYPALIALVHFVIPDWLWAARSLSLLFMTLLVIPLYLLTRDLFDRRAAFWAGLAAALAPAVNDWALDVIRNPPFVFCLLWAVFFSQKAVSEGKALRFLAASALAWLAVLFRVEGIVLIPAFALFLLVLAVRDRGALRLQSLKGLAWWTALPAASILGLFSIYGSRILTANRLDQVVLWARALFTGSFFENYQRIYEQMKALEAASPFPGGKQNFAETARHLMPLIYLLGLLRAFSKVLFVPFVLPLFWAFKHPWDRRRAWVFFLLCAYLLAILLNLLRQDYVEYRFLLAPALLLWPWVGHGVARILQRLCGMGKRGQAASFALVAFLIAVPLGKVIQNAAGEDHAIRWSGQWIKAHPEWKKARVVTNDLRVSLYAGVRGWQEYALHAKGPVPDMEGLERFADKAGAELVIVRISRKQHEALSSLRIFTKPLVLFKGPKRLVAVMAPLGVHEEGESQGAGAAHGDAR